MNKVCVIGGGASGMAAAIAASRLGAEVTILEHKDRLGKKLLSTGNGRCNFTNAHMTARCFRSSSSLDFVEDVLARFGTADTLRFFEELGVMHKSRDGYFYPRSDQAATIVEVLMMELYRRHVSIITEAHVLSVEKKNDGFSIFVKGKKQPYYADKVILSAGAKAASVLGSDGSGYLLAKSLGHAITPVVPALVQLRAKGNFFKKIAGVRAEAKVSIYVDGKYAASETGELQLTNYGISGIPVFQVSRYAAMGLHNHKQVTAEIDFLPALKSSKFKELLEKRLADRRENNAEEFLIGIFHQKLIPVLLTEARIDPRTKVKDLQSAHLKQLVNTCKNFYIKIEDTNSFEQAQVCAGGVPISEIKYGSMESRYVKGAYLTGELLDVDGICGGYNLQWAWATGYLAGTDAAR